MASTLQDGDDNAPLDFLEFKTLSPMSPTMQRALCEAFSDDIEPREDQGWQDVVTLSPIDKSSTISSRDSAEAKRAKRSAIEKKSRQRRQNVLGRMREEVRQLENMYAEMVKKSADARRQEENGILLDNRALSVGALGHKYSQLSLIVQALGEDRARMLKLLEAHDVFQRTAEAMAKRSDGCHEAQDRQDQQGELACDTGLPRSSSFKVTIPKRSPAECYELVRETYEMIQRFDDGGHFVSTGANFMGWTDKRKHDKSGSLLYGFAKNFPLESAEGLLMRTWDVFCHADSMAHLSFDASVTTRFQIVQQLGDDLCIIRRDHKFPNMPMNFLTVHIVFRIQTATGFTLCMRTIPSPHLKEVLEPHEYFYDVFHWTHFNNLLNDDGHPAGCEITTGGYVGDVKQLISKYWLFELVVSVLRWENMCVAPLFLKIMELMSSQHELPLHDGDVDAVLNYSQSHAEKPNQKKKTAKDSSSDQRARRSEIEKKSRQRRQGSLKVMRDEVKVLEREYLRLASRATKATQDSACTSSEDDSSESDHHERGILLDPTQVNALRKKFLRLSSEAAALRKEQKQLHKILNVQQLFRDSFKALASEFVTPGGSDPRWDTVSHANFKPLAMETCFAIMRESYETIASFEAGQDFMTTGASLFGWSDRRRLDDDDSKMIFCFRKAFEDRNTEHLMEESWRTFSDLEFMRRVIFSSQVNLDLEILQVVNRDALVVRRHTRYAAMGRSFHTVYLLFRVQTAQGYTVCFRTIPAPGIQQALGEGELWIDLFHWTTLTRVPDANGMLTGCEISFGGSIGASVMNFATHWMLELIMTVVRWENACVAPLFIKGMRHVALIGRKSRSNRHKSKTKDLTMDDECDMLECCLCGALCGACCASAASDGDDGRRRGRYSDEYRNGQQPVYVQPVVVQQQPGYGPPPPGHPGYGPPPPGYGPPPGEYHQYPPQQYPPGQYPPPQQQQYPHKY
ncbi:hypothetical protein BBI17_000379 [Phytophthora kernoviae]|uniref:BZIP domain-containing protein n=1 Tax=Phytophthora kernoviae TaxID=325452 RepID=A0A3R7J4U7_9STRA|nr:hypothetical protein JM16_001515 [Phytophthora kernoviae]RLN21342.1 hypothetical protein BBI17_000379 [Phytophthora kernoviae]